MLAEKALDLIRELQRTLSGTLSPYNEDKIRQVLEEMQNLYDQNRDRAHYAAGQADVFAAIQLRHAAIQRNKRCLLAYLYNRLEQIRKMRWEFGSVLPSDVRYNMCEQEVQWFTQYNRQLANYMKTIGESGGLDLTQDMKPPKTLYVLVRCIMDHGEFETQDGNIILLKKNSQHYLLRSECEHLIRQGILEHLVH
ncbi:DNA replication complex GINS protein PSF1 isoform X1 [Aplysia californica]|uniref:DNA replication complex GINS protein PSF1 n=1 Tax=Aplysia californica TaxID=6500 RepID=A0ABM0JZ88_APLCA|nr:DNA replication complex GINS protein PSF1 isoform X2 [Aplysia californica]XP_005105029.1 DNA replication complex GINS protein PSF1 isoform X1 [Aplysia californica]